MDLVHLVLILIGVGVLLWLVTLIPMDATMQQIIRAVVIIAVILFLLSFFFPSLRAFRLR